MHLASSPGSHREPGNRMAANYLDAINTTVLRNSTDCENQPYAVAATKYK